MVVFCALGTATRWSSCTPPNGHDAATPPRLKLPVRPQRATAPCQKPLAGSFIAGVSDGGRGHAAVDCPPWTGAQIVCDSRLPPLGQNEAALRNHTKKSGRRQPISGQNQGVAKISRL